MAGLLGPVARLVGLRRNQPEISVPLAPDLLVRLADAVRKVSASVARQCLQEIPVGIPGYIPDREVLVQAEETEYLLDEVHLLADVAAIRRDGDRQAVARLLRTEPQAPKELEGYGERYRPYRSVAAWYCWRAAEVYANAEKSALTT